MAVALKTLMEGVANAAVFGDLKRCQIQGVAIDSREVKQGYLFIAIKGSSTDGHLYIDQAVQTGATAICCQNIPDEMRDGVVYIQVEDTKAVGGLLIGQFYGNPSQELQLVGITGTNGKTSVATLLYQVFRHLDHKCGLISTVEVLINGKRMDATHTTPDPVNLQRILRIMVDEGCRYAFMEVSSHAIDQDRIAGLKFCGAVFTNLSHDHLDYHITFDAYLKAKKKFFDNLDASAFALVNKDDKRGLVMVQNTRSVVKTYGVKSLADFKCKIMAESPEGMMLEIQRTQIFTRLNGRFNAYNLTAVFGTAVLLGAHESDVLVALSQVSGAPGRMEKVLLPEAVFQVIVDYAHTPDALENVLKTIKGYISKGSRVITVIGCGGNRDRSKRPLMGKIAVAYSDLAIFTADNPRSERTEDIISDMMGGVPDEGSHRVLINVDRRSAIQTAMTLAHKGDIILIAGKGHEAYQEIAGIRHPFDDRIIVQEIYRKMSSV